MRQYFSLCLCSLLTLITLSGLSVRAADPNNLPPANEKKLDRIADWFNTQKDKIAPNKPPADLQTDLANQRIEAGKKRLKAAKAKERLEKHKLECQSKTAELTSEYEKAEEDASLYENRLKLQETNIPNSIDGGYQETNNNQPLQ